MREQVSILGRNKVIFLFLNVFSLSLWPTKSVFYGYRGSPSWVKEARPWSWQLISIKCRGWEYV